MVAACEKRDVKLAIAHQTRFSPKLQAVREIIESGQLGTLLELRGRGKEDQRGGGEDLWVLGSHVMNLINFFGGEPKWCFGRVEQNGKPEPLKDGGLPAGNILAVKDLLSAIDNDRQPECNMYEARTTVEMICAVFESHRVGGPVSFPLKTRVNPLTLL